MAKTEKSAEKNKAAATEEGAVKKRRGRPPKKTAEENSVKANTASADTTAQMAVTTARKCRAKRAESVPEEPAMLPKEEKTAKTAAKLTRVKSSGAGKKRVAVKPTDTTGSVSDEAAAVAADVNEALPAEETKREADSKCVQPKYYSFGNLAQLTIAELYKLAESLDVEGYADLCYDELLLGILRNQATATGYGFGSGTLEIKSSENGAGFGFLRPKGLLSSSGDIYVSASQIRRFGLRSGDLVWGMTRPPREGEQYGAILRIENVCYTDPELSRQRPVFEKLTPVFPDKKLKLETEPSKVETRIIDLFAPIGKGQRALIVAPPKAGKTTLLKHIANAITTNHPEVILMVLLVDERPEEVTDMARSVKGEVIASTFDRPAEEHIRVASLALEKAKRLAEVGKDVVLLLDSITRLARASNLVAQPSGRTLSGGMDPAALYFPKKFFGAARNIENGGSFTIIGTTLVETGSRMDDVIYEEFKGTGNMEIQLSRKIAEQRIFPAIDIAKSSTRRDDLLIPAEDLQRLNFLRRKIVNTDEAEALNMVLGQLRATKTNKEFLATIRIS